MKIYSLSELKTLNEYNYYKKYRQEIIETMNSAGKDPLEILLLLEKLDAL